MYLNLAYELVFSPILKALAAPYHNSLKIASISHHVKAFKYRIKYTLAYELKIILRFLCLENY